MYLTRFLPVILLLCFLFTNCSSDTDCEHDLDDDTSVDDDSYGGGDDDDIDDPNSNDPYVFAAIGDYGNNSDDEGDVADLVKSWSPEFIVTLGDNNYKDGELETIEENIAQYYCDFIYNPDAPEYLQCDGNAAQEGINRFYPSLGNHDVHEDDGAPYLLYFTLPGAERYYTYTKGPVQFFVIDSTPDDDDLLCCDSEQSVWLKSELENSDATFKIVYFHHAPFSIGDHGSDEDMQWPFEEWGADAVLSGHEHVYQRIFRKDNPDFMYIVCGVSGKSDEDCGKEDLEDEDDFEVICIDDVHGAMKILVTEEKMTFQFWTVEEPDEPMDEYVLSR